MIAFTQEPLHGLGLKTALENTPFSLLAILNDIDQMALAIGSAEPHVILFDTAHDAAFDHLRRLQNLAPVCQFVALLSRVSTGHVVPLQEMGIHGLIRRDASVDSLTACLQRVSRGQHWIDPELEPFVHQGRRSRLTPHETDIVQLVVAGNSNKEIGAALRITEGTVKSNLSKIFRKVGVDDRLELAMYGLRRLGLASREPASSS